MKASPTPAALVTRPFTTAPSNARRLEGGPQEAMRRTNYGNERWAEEHHGPVGRSLEHDEA